MSRGPGRQQRAILSALSARPYVALCELASPVHEPARYSALQRASLMLCWQGQIDIWRYGYGKGRRVLCRPGVVPPETFDRNVSVAHAIGADVRREAARRVSVGTVSACNALNTYENDGGRVDVLDVEADHA